MNKFGTKDEWFDVLVNFLALVAFLLGGLLLVLLWIFLYGLFFGASTAIFYFAYNGVAPFFHWPLMPVQVAIAFVVLLTIAGNLVRGNKTS